MPEDRMTAKKLIIVAMMALCGMGLAAWGTFAINHIESVSVVIAGETTQLFQIALGLVIGALPFVIGITLTVIGIWVILAGWLKLHRESC